MIKKINGAIYQLISRVHHKKPKSNGRIQQAWLPKLIITLWKKIKMKALSLRRVTFFASPNPKARQQLKFSYNNLVQLYEKSDAWLDGQESLEQRRDALLFLEKAKDNHLSLEDRNEYLEKACEIGLAEAASYLPLFMVDIAKNNYVDLLCRQDCLEFAMKNGYSEADEYFPHFMFEMAKDDRFDFNERQSYLKVAIDNGIKDAQRYTIPLDKGV